jgi:HK97 family phage prohead protease
MEKIYNKLEVRELENNSLSLVCKVNDYTLSKELRGINGVFKELVPRDTWEKAINEKVKFYYNHKPYFELGASAELRAEEDGVYLYATLKDTERGLYDAVKNGEITGMSFGFRCLKDKWDNAGNYKQRTILDMELYEVSILDKTPAYNNTSVEARSLYIPVDLNIYRRQLELYKLR